jgi:hypothetical protein
MVHPYGLLCALLQWRGLAAGLVLKCLEHRHLYCMHVTSGVCFMVHAQAAAPSRTARCRSSHVWQGTWLGRSSILVHLFGQTPGFTHAT